MSGGDLTCFDTLHHPEVFALSSMQPVRNSGAATLTFIAPPPADDSGIDASDRGVFYVVRVRDDKYPAVFGQSEPFEMTFDEDMAGTPTVPSSAPTDMAVVESESSGGRGGVAAAGHEGCNSAAAGAGRSACRPVGERAASSV